MKISGQGEPSIFHRTVAPNVLGGSDVIVIYPECGKLERKNIRVLTYILSIIRKLYDDIRTHGTVDKQAAPYAVLIVDSNTHNTGKIMEYFIRSLFGVAEDLSDKIKFICGDTPTEKFPCIMITTLSDLKACMQMKDSFPFTGY